VAGAIKASQDYASGLMVAVYNLGEGRFVLNTLRIRENLQQHPVAGRLLVNLLRYAGGHRLGDPDHGPLTVPLPPDFDAHLRALGYLD
jgi:hypothetical protein